MGTKDGTFTETHDADRVSRALNVELRRLRKAGLADLTLRPLRYPELTSTFRSDGFGVTDSVALLRHHQRVFETLVADLPTTALRTATLILFHAGSGGTAPPLDERRRAADRAYTGRGYAREPDTVQRHLERKIIDPHLIRALVRLRHSPVVAIRDQPERAPVDQEAWSDDLDRAIIALNRQDFRSMELILARWVGPYPGDVLDEHGLYLRGRSLVLHGDMLRYQGHLFGPGSAQRSYDEAASLFRQFGSQRRLAQVDLAQAITLEMSGEVFGSATQYRALSEDERLRDYERAQARLWIGTALTKAGDIASAIREIDRAVRMFDEQGEPDDWAVAHQKRALASLAAGDIANATRSIEIATSYRRYDSPLEQVRLDTAHGHILTSDARSRDEGLAILQRARETATRYRLAHQLQWIDRIERDANETPARRVR